MCARCMQHVSVHVCVCVYMLARDEEARGGEETGGKREWKEEGGGTAGVSSCARAR